MLLLLFWQMLQDNHAGRDAEVEIGQWESITFAVRFWCGLGTESAVDTQGSRRFHGML